jgi:hypothetical protein
MHGVLLQDEAWTMNISFQWASFFHSRRLRYAQENWIKVMKLKLTSKKPSEAHEIYIIPDVGWDVI